MARISHAGKTIDLIINSLVAMPRGIYEYLKTYADIRSTPGIRAREQGRWEFIGVN